jgi:uncharacterized protein (TIGR00369 family)
MDGFAGMLGVRTTDAVDGRARLEFDAGEQHLNPSGTVHGGVLATLLDTAMGLAVRSSRDDVPATSQLTVTFLRPARTGRLVVTGKVGKQGEHLVVCDGDVEQDGRPVAAAVATFAIVAAG